MPVCYLKQKHMINKQLITRRFSRAVESYNREAVAQKQIAYRMSDMLNHYLPRPCGRILEIGSGTGFLTRRLMETLHPEKLVLNDICQEMSSHRVVGKRAGYLSGRGCRVPSFSKRTGFDCIMLGITVVCFSRAVF